MFPAATEGYPEQEEGSDTPSGTKQRTTFVHGTPVASPIVAVKVVPYAIGELHKKPEFAMHVVPMREPELKIPRENKAARTIAIINIAQPYVIRYSIALCALCEVVFPIQPGRFI
jgi:hypothetical protein